MVALQHDPFMTHGALPPEGPNREYSEQSPLQADEESKPDNSSSRAMVRPVAFLMLVITVGSGFAVFSSMAETGHRDGYEEGHVDGVDQMSGCQSLFYWMLIQFCIDLVITCMTCLVLVPPSISDIMGFFGCCASIRLCALAAGFHILYFSGLQRELCNQFLITWTTILTWIGISTMFCVTSYMFIFLLSGAGSRARQSKVAEPMP